MVPALTAAPRDKGSLQAAIALQRIHGCLLAIASAAAAAAAASPAMLDGALTVWQCRGQSPTDRLKIVSLKGSVGLLVRGVGASLGSRGMVACSAANSACWCWARAMCGMCLVCGNPIHPNAAVRLPSGSRGTHGSVCLSTCLSSPAPAASPRLPCWT